MEYKELISKRHSVRSFDGRAVDVSELDAIIGEALTAPSSKNTRSTGLVKVLDKKVLEAISAMRTSGSAFVAEAPAAIVVTGDTSCTDLWVENCSISATYLMLSAVEHGLGSCWVHVHGRLRDKNDESEGMAEDYLRGLLGIPDGTGILCVVALGYEAHTR